MPIEAQEGFYGKQAKTDLYTHLRSKPPQHHQRILEATIIEQQRGWLGPFRTANDLNKEFGAGMWRFIPRLQQRLRDRLIDNVNTGKQYRFTQCPETIYTITLDWLGITLKCLEVVFAERCPECTAHPFPEQTLSKFADQRACVVAVWSEHSGKWLFAKSYSCLFGIGSVVVSFDRLPALATAVSKSLGICMCAAYFDDLITLESLNFRASARPFLLLVLSALGAPPTPAKSFPLGQHRAWLGAALNLATLKDDLYFTLQPKESSVTQVIQGCHLAIARGSLTPAEASTLRRQAGWTATLSAGRFGWIGMHFLKTRQYQSHFERSTLDEDDVQTLKFLVFFVSVAPPRAVFFGRSCRPPSRIYSDASHTEGVRTRLGWVLFTNNVTTPMGYWYDIPASSVQDWNLTHPIMAVESFAVLTAIWQHLFTGKDVIFFIVNEAAASDMIKGDSRLPVVGTMAMCVQLLLIRYNIAVWFEWVDADSNLAESLGRDCAADSWTLEQDWELHEFQGLPFAISLVSLREQVFPEFVGH